MNTVLRSSFSKASLAYRLSQVIFAPGAEIMIGNCIKCIAENLSIASPRVLDVGCGPFSRLWAIGLRPVGVDLSIAYSASFRCSNESVITASADALPLRDKSFDGIWSFGLLHHLSDDVVHRVIDEMKRVIRPEGYIVIFDAVKPKSLWREPLAFLIRKMDRGHFMREQYKLEKILSVHGDWACQRVKYSLTGLEGIFCIYPAKMMNRRMAEVLKKEVIA